MSAGVPNMAEPLTPEDQKLVERALQAGQPMQKAVRKSPFEGKSLSKGLRKWKSFLMYASKAVDTLVENQDIIYPPAQDEIVGSKKPEQQSSRASGISGSKPSRKTQIANNIAFEVPKGDDPDSGTPGEVAEPAPLPVHLRPKLKIPEKPRRDDSAFAAPSLVSRDRRIQEQRQKEKEAQEIAKREGGDKPRKFEEIGEFADKYSQYIFNIANSISNDPELALEALQEHLLKENLHQGLDTPRLEGSNKGKIYREVRNLTIDLLKKKNKQKEKEKGFAYNEDKEMIGEPEGKVDLPPDEELMQEETKRQVLNIVDQIKSSNPIGYMALMYKFYGLFDDPERENAMKEKEKQERIKREQAAHEAKIAQKIAKHNKEIERAEQSGDFERARRLKIKGPKIRSLQKKGPKEEVVYEKKRELSNEDIANEINSKGWTDSSGRPFTAEQIKGILNRTEKAVAQMLGERFADEVLEDKKNPLVD